MSNKLKLSTKDESLREILSNGKKYFVPKFQRDYSWEKEHWDILWEDISIAMLEHEEHHYMGYLVLQESQQNNKEYKIIDGQQRLTTFSLLVLAANKRLLELDNQQERIDELHKNFIGSKDLIKLQMSNKIKLNRNNDYYYNVAVEGGELPKRANKKTVILMGKALAFFYQQFKQYNTGEDIGRVIDTISNLALFTTIYISDEMNAYKVFETLNARGAKLSSSDLIKNYLFSVIAQNDANLPDEVFDKLDQKWEHIGKEIGDTNYTDYLLAAWNSQQKFTRSAALFQNVRNNITDNQSADDYLSQLEQNAQLYAALLDYDHEFWKESPDYLDIKAGLYFLKLFNIRQPISLLFISYIKHPQNFAKILKWLTHLCMRYNVICREHTAEQEVLYNRICLLINDDGSLDDVRQQLLSIYPNDEKFKVDFANKTFPTMQSNKKARYVLTQLEGFLNPHNVPEEVKLTIEHILPETPNEQWQLYFGTQYSQYNQRLGNMALVSPKLNKDLDQLPFNDKKDLLSQRDTHEINKNLQDYEEWDQNTISSRQQKMADIAVRCWRID